MSSRDLTGRRFDRLVVVGPAGKSPAGASRWICLCDCGQECTRVARSLERGDATSCGCKRKDGRRGTHGLSDSPEYICWLAMRQRCSDPNHDNFRYYGGRGISVFGPWQESFERFLADMGPRPSSKRSIEREDPNGNYEPGNCHWATKKEQARNTRATRWLTIGSETLSLAEWAERTGLNAWTIRGRVERGLSPEEAIATRPRGTGRNGSSEHCSRGHLFTEKSTYITRHGRRMCRICANTGRRVKRAAAAGGDIVQAAMGRPMGANVTHCPKGHPYDEKNTIHGVNSYSGNPRRACRACSVESNRRTKRMRRLARLAAEQPKTSKPVVVDRTGREKVR